MTQIDSVELVRTRLASRESFFGGPLCTRDQSKAISWKEMPNTGKGRSLSKAGIAQQRAGPALSKQSTHKNLGSSKLNRRKLTRDFSGLQGDTKPPTATAAALLNRPSFFSSTKPSSQTQKGRGKKGDAGRASSMPPAGNSRQHKADTALAARVSQLTMAHRAAQGNAAGANPSPDKTTRNGVSRQQQQQKPQEQKKQLEPEAVMRRHQQSTALGVQTVQLVRRRTAIVDARLPKQNSQQLLRPAGKPLAITPLNAHSRAGALSQRREPQPRVPGAARRPNKAAGARPTKPMNLQGTFYGNAQPPSFRRRVRTVDDESCSDLDSFIDDEGVDHEEESEVEGEESGGGRDASGGGGGGWRRVLKETLGGYDPSKFADIDRLPDKRMHASFGEIAAEEARAAKIAREVDRREAEREAAEKEEKRKRRLLEGKRGDIDDSSDEEEEDEVEGDGEIDGGGGSGGDGESSDEDDDIEGGVRHKKRRKLCAFIDG